MTLKLNETIRLHITKTGQVIKLPVEMSVSKAFAAKR